MYFTISRLPAFAVPSLIVIQSEQLGEKHICGRFTSNSDTCISQLERNAAGKTLKQEIRKHLAKEWTRRNEGKGKAKL